MEKCERKLLNADKESICQCTKCEKHQNEKIFLQRKIHQLEERLDQCENDNRQNNLRFYGIPTVNRESPLDCEEKVLDVIYRILGFRREVPIHRAHRTGRAIVVQFSSIRDRDLILSNVRRLKGTQFSVREDVSPMVRQKQKGLLPLYKSLRKERKRANIYHDKLVTSEGVFTYDLNSGKVVRVREPDKRCKTPVYGMSGNGQSYSFLTPNSTCVSPRLQQFSASTGNPATVGNLIAGNGNVTVSVTDTVNGCSDMVGQGTADIDVDAARVISPFSNPDTMDMCDEISMDSGVCTLTSSLTSLPSLPLRGCFVLPAGQSTLRDGHEINESTCSMSSFEAPRTHVPDSSAGVARQCRADSQYAEGKDTICRDCYNHTTKQEVHCPQVDNNIVCDSCNKEQELNLQGCKISQEQDKDCHIHPETEQTSHISRHEMGYLTNSQEEASKIRQIQHISQHNGQLCRAENKQNKNYSVKGLTGNPAPGNSLGPEEENGMFIERGTENNSYHSNLGRTPAFPSGKEFQKTCPENGNIPANSADNKNREHQQHRGTSASPRDRPFVRDSGSENGSGNLPKVNGGRTLKAKQVCNRPPDSETAPLRDKGKLVNGHSVNSTDTSRKSARSRVGREADRDVGWHRSGGQWQYCHKRATGDAGQHPANKEALKASLEAVAPGASTMLNGNGALSAANGRGEVAAQEQDHISRKLTEMKDSILQPIKEDLSEWITRIIGVEITPDTFMEVLDSGVALCTISKLIEKHAQDYAKQGKLTEPLPKFKLRCNSRAKSGTWFSRDNVTNFLGWCRAYGMTDETMFDSEDLVSHKQEKPVVNCVLELARIGWRYGIEPPNLIRMEREIETEAQEFEPPPYVPPPPPPVVEKPVEPPPEIKKPEKIELHKEVKRLAHKCKCQEYVNRISEGVYDVFGRRVFIRLLHGKHLMVRVGGGWDTFENYLLHHDPIQVYEFRRSDSQDNLKANFDGYLVIRSKYKSLATGL